MFFQNRYFKGKDLSGLNNCIAELFQNIFDHSESNGTSFSYIEYNENKSLINIAVCDFGKGIPATLSKQFPDEKAAMEMSLKPGITAGSKRHNKGYGMQNIISTLTESDELRIISNHIMLYYHDNDRQLYSWEYDFKGTLLYMTIQVSSFPDEEIMDSFIF